MANNYMEFSEEILNITDKEKEWIETFLLTACPDMDEDLAGHEEWCKERGPVPGDQGDINSYPGFKWSIRASGDIGLYAEEYFNIDFLTTFVQLFLRKFRPTQIFTVTYAEWCSSPRVGQFSGGWSVVSAFDVHCGHCNAAAEAAARHLQARVELEIQSKVESTDMPKEG